MAEDWQFLRNWMIGVRPEEAPPRGQFDLLFRHHVGGLAAEKELQAESWKPLKSQKHKQLLFAMGAQGVFHKLALRCQAEGFKIIPLKGVSLAKTVFSADPSCRQLSDIDLLLLPENLMKFHAIALEMGYVQKKKHMLEPEYQKVKRKAEYKHHAPHMPGLDVHSAFVVKKTLARHAGLDLESVFARTRDITTKEGTCAVLDPVDEWLFLAYHYGLHHQFSGLKWLVDIHRLTLAMTDEQWRQLLERARTSGLEKVMLATLQNLEVTFDNLPVFCQRRPQRRLGFVTRLWLNDALSIKRQMYRELGHGRNGTIDKVGEYLWEFLFIDQPAQQRRAFLTMLFPSRAMTTAILGLKNRALYLLLFPLYPLLGMLLLISFGVLSTLKAATVKA